MGKNGREVTHAKKVPRDEVPGPSPARGPCDENGLPANSFIRAAGQPNVTTACECGRLGKGSWWMRIQSAYDAVPASCEGPRRSSFGHRYRSIYVDGVTLRSACAPGSLVQSTLPYAQQLEKATLHTSTDVLDVLAELAFRAIKWGGTYLRFDGGGHIHWGRYEQRWKMPSTGHVVAEKVAQNQANLHLSTPWG
jgi:hypothetical protein